MNVPKSILVPNDFSDLAEHSLDYALALAEPLGATVHVVHAYTIPPFPEGMSLAPGAIDQVSAAASKALEQSLSKRGQQRALGQSLVTMGDPREVILNAARELGADLIVIGTHGRSGIPRLVLGSVAEAVMRTASCPVLAVRIPSNA